jgi:hypothetical protein
MGDLQFTQKGGESPFFTHFKGTYQVNYIPSQSGSEYSRQVVRLVYPRIDVPTEDSSTFDGVWNFLKPVELKTWVVIR